jgi:hypothetical protein
MYPTAPYDVSPGMRALALHEMEEQCVSMLSGMRYVFCDKMQRLEHLAGHCAHGHSELTKRFKRVLWVGTCHRNDPEKNASISYQNDFLKTAIEKLLLTDSGISEAHAMAMQFVKHNCSILLDLFIANCFRFNLSREATLDRAPCKELTRLTLRFLQIDKTRRPSQLDEAKLIIDKIERVSSDPGLQQEENQNLQTECLRLFDPPDGKLWMEDNHGQSQILAILALAGLKGPPTDVKPFICMPITEAGTLYDTFFAAVHVHAQANPPAVPTEYCYSLYQLFTRKVVHMMLTMGRTNRMRIQSEYDHTRDWQWWSVRPVGKTLKSQMIFGFLSNSIFTLDERELRSLEAANDKILKDFSRGVFIYNSSKSVTLQRAKCAIITLSMDLNNKDFTRDVEAVLKYDPYLPDYPELHRELASLRREMCLKRRQKQKRTQQANDHARTTQLIHRLSKEVASRAVSNVIADARRRDQEAALARKKEMKQFHAMLRTLNAPLGQKQVEIGKRTARRKEAERTAGAWPLRAIQTREASARRSTREQKCVKTGPLGLTRVGV